MFNWALSERITKETPFDNVELLKVPEDEFHIISKAHERKLLDACALQTLTGLRDALMISFLLDTGVRIGECVRIHAHEVDIVNRSVLVRAESAKTRKARTVYFGGRTQKLLAVYGTWHEKNAGWSALYVLGWALIGVGVQWFAGIMGLFHYQHGFKIYYSFIIYLIVNCFGLALYFRLKRKGFLG